jgi:hypothetical protein
MAKQGKRVAEEIVARLLRRLSQWLSHHVMLSKVNAAYLNEEQVLTIWFCWLSCLHPQIHMTDVQLNYINDGNKHFWLYKLSHSIKQKLISAKTLYIITLFDSNLSEAQMWDQIGFSSATISYVHSQFHSNLLKASNDDPSKLTITNINKY